MKSPLYRFAYFCIFLINKSLCLKTDDSISLWTWDFLQESVYSESLPKPRQSTSSNVPSACANGGYGSSDYGFACPHMMMFSRDMILASQRDGYDKEFWYATAGGSSDQDCGACYQVQVLDAERVWKSDFKYLILQIINSGFDVMTGQYDIFMGAGGFGYFTACNRDCQQTFCQGGSCHASNYDSSFDAWNNAHYADPNQCYSGGVKWLNESSLDVVVDGCSKIIQYDRSTFKHQTFFDSCVQSNTELFHQNFVSLHSKRVQCPDSLTRLTGLRRADDGQYPLPWSGHTYDIECRGDRTQGHYCITTMMDCCKPSCAWPNKGNPDAVWSRVDTCRQDGSLFDY